MTDENASMTATSYTAGESDTRPWGRWKVLAAEPDFILKKIVVESGQRLSLQYHKHRSEHWVVVNGHGLVTIGGDQIAVGPGRHVYIPSETQHRIENTSDAPLVFVEVQFGEVLDEMDIVRIEDDYER